MDKQLEIIRNLRNEIEELTSTKYESKLELDECSQRVQDTSDEINIINNKWRNDKEIFDNIWHKKIGRLIAPFCCVLCVFMGMGFGKLVASEFGMKLFSYFIGFSMSISLVFIFGYSNIQIYDIYYEYPCYNFFSKYYQYVVNKLRKFLFKRYPYIEKMYSDLRVLVDEISQKEKQLEQLKIDKKELETKFENICDLLSRKKDELVKLEGECLDSLISNTMDDEKDTEIITESLGKGKTRVRIPEDN